MAKRSIEIERKYDVEDQGTVPDLSSLGEVQPEPEILLRAAYYDTADLRLAKAATALRRREGGADAGWHIKGPAAEGRTETHAALADEPPQELLDDLAAVLRGRQLTELARLSTRRTILRLSRDGRPIAEIADDSVSATDVRSGVLRIWREWEVELVADPGSTPKTREALLDEIEKVLVKAGARPSASGSKLARSLGYDRLGDGLAARSADAHGAGAHGPAEGRSARDAKPLTKRSPASDVVVAAAQDLVAELVAADGPARRNEDDAVHQLRTRIRRLRSVLAGYRDVLDRGVTDDLRERLRALGTMLGAARDLEVREAGVRAVLDRHGDELSPFALGIREWAAGDLEHRRQAAFDAALAELNSERYYALLDDLDALVASPPLTSRSEKRAGKELMKALQKEGRRALARGSAIDPSDIASLHDARKAARRLRYAADAVSSGRTAVFGKRVAKLSDRAHAVQDVLGDHRDLVELAHLAEADPNSAAARMVPALRLDAEATLSRFPDAFADLRKAIEKLD